MAYENPISHASGTVFLNGVNQQHYGIETQLKLEVSHKLAFNTMISLGNWEYSGKAQGDAYDFAQQNIGSLDLTLDHLKVGDAAQFTSFFLNGIQTHRKIQKFYKLSIHRPTLFKVEHESKFERSSQTTPLSACRYRIQKPTFTKPQK